MLGRGVVLVLGPLVALAASEPTKPGRRALNVSAGVDIELDEDPEIGVDVALGFGDYTEPDHP